MLKEIFYPIYEVHTAGNGKEGFEQALTIQPDIVLSDVMMPEMSGKEMCYKIKNTVNLSHIPVVLLTAQTSVEYTIEGYMYEADDYITKPFNVKLLVSRCNNLVKSRRKLIEKFRNQQPATVTDIAVNQADRESHRPSGQTNRPAYHLSANISSRGKHFVPQQAATKKTAPEQAPPHRTARHITSRQAYRPSAAITKNSGPKAAAFH